MSRHFPLKIDPTKTVVIKGKPFSFDELFKTHGMDASAKKKTKLKILLRGKPLIISAGAQMRYTSVIDHHVLQMTQRVNDKIEELFRSEAAHSHIKAMGPPEETGQDASVGSQARILTNALKKQFDKLFGTLSTTLATNMVADINQSSKTSIDQSTQEINRKNEGKKLTLSTSALDQPTIDILKASVAYSTSFIQSIPEDYLNKVT